MYMYVVYFERVSVFEQVKIDRMMTFSDYLLLMYSRYDKIIHFFPGDSLVPRNFMRGEVYVSS